MSDAKERDSAGNRKDQGEQRLHLCVCVRVFAAYLFSEGHAPLLRSSRLLDAADEFEGDGTALAFLRRSSDIRTHARKVIPASTEQDQSRTLQAAIAQTPLCQEYAHNAMPRARTLTSIGGARRGPVDARRERKKNQHRVCSDIIHETPTLCRVSGSLLKVQTV